MHARRHIIAIYTSNGKVGAGHKTSHHFYWKIGPSNVGINAGGCIPVWEGVSQCGRVCPSVGGCVPVWEGASQCGRVCPSVWGCAPMCEGVSYSVAGCVSVKCAHTHTPYMPACQVCTCEGWHNTCSSVHYMCLSHNTVHLSAYHDTWQAGLYKAIAHMQAIEYKYLKLYILIIALCINYNIMWMHHALVCYSYIIELHAECMYIFSCVCQGHRLCMEGGGHSHLYSCPQLDTKVI